MNNKKPMNKLREWIQENFFGLIIFLVILLTIILIISLFLPINTEGLPNKTLELDKYSAGVDQRTIIIRSISYIISGISVVIAFVSLLQSKNSELKRERLQVMPFPAYTVPIEEVKDASTSSSRLLIQQKAAFAKSKLQGEFDIHIKNIGLGSLVDFEIKEAYYKKDTDNPQKLETTFLTNFILGQQETIRIGVLFNTEFKAAKPAEFSNLIKIYIVATFDDLLGHSYRQEFAIESDIQATGQEYFTGADDQTKIRYIHSITPRQINHTHPFEI